MDSQIPSSSKHNEQSLKPPEKRFKHDEKIHSSLSSRLEFSPPKIVEYSSVNEYCDKLQNSAHCKTINQTSDNLTQIQKRVESVSLSEFNSSNKPHFPISVEELSVATNVDNWTNTNVRVCGIVKQDEYNLSHYLESIKEDGGPFTILLDLDCFYRIPVLNRTLQIFGEIVIVSKKPILRVYFYRDLSKVNFSLFRKAEEKFKSFVPMFVKKKNSYSTCQLNDTLDDCDFGNLLD